MKHFLILINIFIFSFAFCFGQEKLPKKTIVTPYMNHTISLDSNVIYCATFQIAWNELKKVTGENILLSNQPAMADSLNKGIAAKKYINTQDYFVKSGIATKKFITDLNKELKKKFKGVFSPIKDKPNSLYFIIYAFLYKNLKFKQEYEKIDNGLLFSIDSNGNNEHVNAFGINSFKNSSKEHRNLANQTEIYMNIKNEFAVILKPNNTSDQIILSEIQTSDTLTLTNAYNHIINIVNTNPPVYFDKKLGLRIPVINFDLNHSFDNLINKTIKNKVLNNYLITEAYQTISFKLDEKGAIVKSKAKIELLRSISFGNDRIIFSFNKPFFVILKEKDSPYPYLIIWVANPSILQKEAS